MIITLRELHALLHLHKVKHPNADNHYLISLADPKLPAVFQAAQKTAMSLTYLSEIIGCHTIVLNGLFKNILDAERLGLITLRTHPMSYLLRRPLSGTSYLEQVIDLPIVQIAPLGQLQVSSALLHSDNLSASVPAAAASSVLTSTREVQADQLTKAIQGKFLKLGQMLEQNWSLIPPSVSLDQAYLAAEAKTARRQATIVQPQPQQHQQQELEMEQRLQAAFQQELRRLNQLQQDQEQLHLHQIQIQQQQQQLAAQSLGSSSAPSSADFSQNSVLLRHLDSLNIHQLNEILQQLKAEQARRSALVMANVPQPQAQAQPQPPQPAVNSRKRIAQKAFFENKELEQPPASIQPEDPNDPVKRAFSPSDFLNLEDDEQVEGEEVSAPKKKKTG